jgi:hypothetical protein
MTKEIKQVYEANFCDWDSIYAFEEWLSKQDIPECAHIRIELYITEQEEIIDDK